MILLKEIVSFSTDKRLIYYFVNENSFFQIAVSNFRNQENISLRNVAGSRNIENQDGFSIVQLMTRQVTNAEINLNTIFLNKTK
jgi:hypothetical protein